MEASTREADSGKLLAYLLVRRVREARAYLPESLHWSITLRGSAKTGEKQARDNCVALVAKQVRGYCIAALAELKRQAITKHPAVSESHLCVDVNRLSSEPSSVKWQL